MLTTSFLTDILILSIPLMMIIHAFYQHKKRRWILIDPLNAFWAGCLVCYVFQPLTHYNIYVEWYSEPVVQRALMWTLFGLFFVILGYESNVGKRAVALRPLGISLPPMPARLSPGRMVAAGGACIVLGLLGYVYLISTAPGGFSAWLSVGRGGTNVMEINSYIAQLEQFLPLGVMLLLFHVEFHRADIVQRSIVWAAAALMWLWLAYLGSRSRMLVFTGIMIAAYYIPRRKNPPLWLIAPLSVVMIFLVSFLAHYRGSFTNGSFHLEDRDWQEVWNTVVSPTFNPTEGKNGASRGEEFSCVVAVTDIVPTRVPYNKGYFFLEILTRAIPRAIWPGKIYPALETVDPVFREADLSRSTMETGSGTYLVGPALTYIGFYYLIGGPVALAIFGYLTGIFFRIIRNLFDRVPGHEANTIIYLYLISLGFGEAAGTPTAWVFSVPIVFIPLALFLYFCGDKMSPRENLNFSVLTVQSS